MKFVKALTLSLGKLKPPVLLRYQVGVIVHQLYKEKSYKGEQIHVTKGMAERADFNNYLNQLLDEGVLSERSDLPKGVLVLLGKSPQEADEVVCAVDPFAYVSHLSAMEFHGLTDRMPGKLFVSSPGDKDWKFFADQKMNKDLKEDYVDYQHNGMPLLVRTPFKKIGRTEVHCMHSKHLGAYKNVRDKGVRVATVGRTFLDMLRDPDLCGGINHVLDVFEEYGDIYIKHITDELDQHGNQIEKVRAGYILDERMGIKNEVVDSWMQYVQRGGSRKLDAKAEYESVWSEKWCLSLNVPGMSNE